MPLPSKLWCVSWLASKVKILHPLNPNPNFHLSCSILAARHVTWHVTSVRCNEILMIWLRRQHASLVPIQSLSVSFTSLWTSNLMSTRGSPRRLNVDVRLAANLSSKHCFVSNCAAFVSIIRPSTHKGDSDQEVVPATLTIILELYYFISRSG